MKENNVVTSEANRKLCQGWEHDDFQRKQCTNQKNRPFGLQGNNRYKITTFLSEQRNLKWKSRDDLEVFLWNIADYS